MLQLNSIHCADCLEKMKEIDDKSIDLILADLPYGTTACKWDTIIPFELLWKEYKRIIKDNGAIVLTASQPFTSALVMSNIKMFKYEWIWEKSQGVNFAQSNYMPLLKTESVLVFGNFGMSKNSKLKGIFNLSGLVEINKIKKGKTNTEHRNSNANPEHIQKYSNYPNNILRNYKQERGLHPTQKPVALFEYLIKTYTNEGGLVLDNCAGSFTTAIASENLKRNWICIEKEAKYCAIGEKRIKENRERLLNIANCAKSE